MNKLLFTIDTEPDWGISGTRGVEDALPRLLELLEERRIAATFFVSGRLVQPCRDALLEIGPQHEIASHGYNHRRLSGVPREEVRDELRRSRLILAELGREIEGVRAPFFATPQGWLEEVADAGYKYDASAGCVRPSMMNRRWPAPAHGLGRLGVSVLRDGITPFCLTYLRLYHPLGLHMMPQAAPGCPVMFYLHLHEFLPPETAARLKTPLRWMLTRNCGEAAWDILRRALDRLDGEWITCSEYLRTE